MNKLIFFSITLAIGGAVFILVVKDTGIHNIFNIVSNLNPRQFAILFFLNAAGFLVSSLRWKIILNANGDFASFRKILAARMVGFSINYLTPSGLVLGEPFKAMVLSAESNIKIGSAMVSIVIEGAIFLSILLLFITLGIISLITYSPVSDQVFAITAFVFVFMIATAYLFYSKMIRKNIVEQNKKGFFTYIIETLHLDRVSFIDRLKNRISIREKEIKSFFSLHRNIIYTAAFLSVLELGILFLSYWLAIYFLGFDLNIKVLLGVTALMYIATLLPLPASLGGLELSQIFAFNFFNLGGQTTAIGFSIIIRIISLIFTAIGIFYLAYFEIKTIFTNKSLFFLKLQQKSNELFQKFYKK